MIKFIHSRIKDGEASGPESRDMSIENALEILVQYEMGWGGMVTELNVQSIEIVTTFMGCQDTTRFEGSAEHMKLLYGAVSIWAAIVKKAQAEKQGLPFTESEIKHAAQRGGGNPRVLSLMAGFLLSFNRPRIVYMGLLAEDESQYLKLSKITSVKDLHNLVVLKRIEGEDISFLY